MFDFPYLIELLSPRRDAGEKIAPLLERFKQRYEQATTLGCGISVPDNPMGRPRLGLPECISRLGLTVDPDKVVMNLNTFHAKAALDELLVAASALGIRQLLVVRGDGGPELERLDPASIGCSQQRATSAALVRYINRQYPGRFLTGVAFNPYKKFSFEGAHLKKKIEAGARFIITQPLFGRNQQVDAVLNYGLPLVVEAWMSENIALFNKSVGQQQDQAVAHYNPKEAVQKLHQAYPDSCVYLAMLNFSASWPEQLPRLSR